MIRSPPLCCGNRQAAGRARGPGPRCPHAVFGSLYRMGVHLVHIMRSDLRRPLGIFPLIGLFLLALSLPRFGFLGHSHPGGEGAHTHTAQALRRAARLSQAPSADGHRHSHPHPHTHAHGPTHPVEGDKTVRLAGNPAPGVHTHYFDDSLPVGGWCPPVLLLTVLAIFLRPCRRASPGSRQLAPPTARAPPVRLCT
jgi:hypothetical protein